MELTKVESSNINAIGYENGGIIVEYKSGVRYKYNNAPEALYKMLLESESKGSFVNQHIKNVYTYEKLLTE